MPPQPTPTEPTPAQDTGGNTQHHRHILNEMIDLGADLARLVHQLARHQLQADAQPTTEPAPPSASNDNRGPAAADLIIAFDRVTRAVRRTILLAQHLDAPPRPLSGGLTRTATRTRIIRAVEDTIQRECRPAQGERLYAEFLDRLDAPEFAEDLEGRPIAEVIDEVCHDLGLDIMPGTHPWKRRTPADLATLHARASAPSRPPSCVARPGVVPLRPDD